MDPTNKQKNKKKQNQHKKVIENVLKDYFNANFLQPFPKS